MVRIVLGAAMLEAGKGGIVRVARMTARALAAHDHAVTAVSYLDKEPPEIDGVRVVTAGGSKPVFALKCHVAALRAQAMVFDSVGIALARPRIPGLRRRHAVWMHGIEAWEKLRPGREAIYQAADVVLVNSAYTLERFERLHGPLPNARVCWLATEDDAPPAPSARAPGRPPTAMILGRIDRSEQYKGHYELIAAWPRIVAAVPGARLLIAGGGDDFDNVRAAAEASPVAGQIDLRGFVPESAMPALWAETDVFTMPCRGGGFGLVYVEAMRQSLPVIASVHDAAPEVNIEGETGFNIALDDQEAMVDRFVRLLGNPDQARTMGAAGYARWQKHFRLSAFGERMMAILDTAGLTA